jgi:hypothetical protein
MSEGPTHEFDGDLLIVQQIGPLENNAKRTLSNFLSYSIVYADDIG